MGIPDCESPLSVHSLNACGPIFLKQVENYLRVGTSNEMMSLGRKLFAEFEVVEDFAVVANDEPGFGKLHRLMTTLGVDDAEPGMAQTDAAIQIYFLSVRPSMTLKTNHAE
jgi:hypothetical protein